MALPPTGLILEGSRTLTTLTGLRTALALARTDVEVKLNTLELARWDYAIRQEAILGRVTQLADNIRSFWSTTSFARALHDIPSSNEFPPDLERALDNFNDLWVRINGTSPPSGVVVPLTLSTEPTVAVPTPLPYTQSLFATDIAALKAAYMAFGNAKTPVNASRGTRNGLQDQIRPILVDYREAVPSKLPPHHSLLESLPRYSPLPGSTPEPANISGIWDAATSMAFLNFTPSPSASVVKHQLRYVPGPVYDADDENVVDNILVGSPSHFQTLAGLPLPGTTSSFRIYAMTADGHERASATVTITRPL